MSTTELYFGLALKLIASVAGVVFSVKTLLEVREMENIVNAFLSKAKRRKP